MSKLDYFHDMYCMTEKQTNTVMNPKGIKAFSQNVRDAVGLC